MQNPYTQNCSSFYFETIGFTQVEKEQSNKRNKCLTSTVLKFSFHGLSKLAREKDSVINKEHTWC